MNSPRPANLTRNASIKANDPLKGSGCVVDAPYNAYLKGITLFKRRSYASLDYSVINSPQSWNFPIRLEPSLRDIFPMTKGRFERIEMLLPNAIFDEKNNSFRLHS